jgi:hypothetical protein
MKPTDYKYLDSAKAAFVESAIERVAESGRMQYQFTISGEEVKNGLQRERLREETIDGVIDYFAGEGIQAEHDAARDRFRVTLNLHDAAMSPDEAKFLSVAMNKFRVEHL